MARAAPGKEFSNWRIPATVPIAAVTAARSAHVSAQRFPHRVGSEVDGRALPVAGLAETLRGLPDSGHDGRARIEIAGEDRAVHGRTPPRSRIRGDQTR